MVPRFKPGHHNLDLERTKLGNRLSKTLYPYYFIAPAVLFFAAFMAYPVIYTLALSFFNWTGIHSPPFENFVGIKNFVEINVSGMWVPKSEDGQLTFISYTKIERIR